MNLKIIFLFIVLVLLVGCGGGPSIPPVQQQTENCSILNISKEGQTALGQRGDCPEISSGGS